MGVAGLAAVRIRADGEMKVGCTTKIGYPTAVGRMLADLVRSYDTRSFARRLRRVRLHVDDAEKMDDGWPRDMGRGPEVMRYLMTTTDAVDLYCPYWVTHAERLAPVGLEGIYELDLDAEALRMTYHGICVALDLDLVSALLPEGLTALFDAFERYADERIVEYGGTEDVVTQSVTLATDLALVAYEVDPYGFADSHDDFSGAIRELTGTLCSSRAEALEPIAAYLDELAEGSGASAWVRQKASQLRGVIGDLLREAPRREGGVR